MALKPLKKKLHLILTVADLIIRYSGTLKNKLRQT